MSKAKALIDKNLQEYKAKPLIPLAQQELAIEIKKPNTTIDSFKPLYQKDPIFSWAILGEAFERTKDKASQPFAVDHAMSTIGLGGVEQTIKRFKSYSPFKISDEVNFQLTTSLLAAEIAGKIGESSLGKPQTRWTALMYQMPDTLLWYLHPKSMWRIHYRRLTLPKNLSLFEESKLGFNLFEWRQTVASHFHMSQSLKQIYEKLTPTNPRELLAYSKEGLNDRCPSLKLWHRQEDGLILLSNRLASAIMSPWHKNSVTRHFNMLSQLTALPVNHLKPLVYQAVASVSAQLMASPLMAPASIMLMQLSKPHFPDWLNNKAAIKLRVAEKKKSKANKPETEITPILKKLTLEANQFNNSAELIHYGLRAIVKKLGFCRVSFLSINRKAKLAETKIALSEDDTKKIRPDFSFSKPTPLTKFIEQQAFMLIDKTRHEKIWPKLPIEIQKTTDKFVLYSLKPGQQVRALIYIDSKKQTAFSPSQFNMLKLILKALNKGLAIRNKVKQQKQKKPAKKASL